MKTKKEDLEKLRKSHYKKIGRTKKQRKLDYCKEKLSINAKFVLLASKTRKI